MSEFEQYLILVEGGISSNYSAWSPDIPGCVATGPTIAECVSEMHAAIAEHISIMRSHGEAIPAPSGPGVYVERKLAA